MREPIVEVNILVPQEHIGNVITLCVEKRGVQKKMDYHGTQVSLNYELHTHLLRENCIFIHPLARQVHQYGKTGESRRK